MVGKRLGLLLGLVAPTAYAFLLPVQISMVARASTKIWRQAKEGNFLYDGEELVEGTIYVLYKASERVTLYDIVFFHGLQLGDFSNAWNTTWESVLPGGQKICWPAEFLGKDFPRARVLSVSYDASARQSPKAGCSDLETIGQNLGEYLVGEGVGTRPVVLVGHSLGGLVLKQVCLEVDEISRSSDGSRKDLAEAFLGNVKGMVFYATPHEGSKLADFVQAVARLIPSIVVTSGPVVSFLEVLNTGRARLNTAFNLLRSRYNWATLGFKENHETTAGKFFHDIVVPEASAYRDMDRRIAINQDHIQICKPKSVIAPAYKSLKEFLAEHLDVVQSPQGPRDVEMELIGRADELEEVCSALYGGKVVLIHGGPGEGKTRLASEARRKVPCDWASIDLAGKRWSTYDETEEALMRELLMALKLCPEEDCPKGDSAWRSLVKKAKSKPVVVYESTEALMSGDYAHVFYDLINKLANHGVRQIITSRLSPRLPEKYKELYKVVRLSLLSKDDAVGILRRKYQDLDPADAERIVDVCKGNPYLSIQVGHHVLKGDIDVAKETKESAFWPDAIRKMLTTYYESLSDLSGDGKRVLAYMCLWHSFTYKDVRRLETIRHINTALETLERYGILYRSEKGRYEMHVICQKAAEQGMLEQEAEDAKEHFLKAMVNIARDLRCEFMNPDGDIKKRASDVLACELPNCGRFCAIPKDFQDLQDLRFLGAALSYLRHYREALSVRKEIYNHVNRSGAHLLEKLSCQMELAWSLGLEGDLKAAEKECRKALIGFESLGHFLDLGKLICYHMISTFSYGQGKYTEAKHYATSMMDISLLPIVFETFIPIELQEVWMINQATILVTEGQYIDAEEKLNAAAGLRHGAPGAEHEDSTTFGDSKRILTWSLRGQGKDDNATRLYDIIQEDVEKQHTVEHPGGIRRILDLAWWRLCQGNYTSAMRLHEKALEACQCVLRVDSEDKDHMLVLASHAIKYLSLRGHDKGTGELSEEMCINVVEPARRRWGRQHPDTLLFIYLLCALMRGEGKHYEAETLHREGLAELQFSMQSLQWYLDEQRKYMQAEWDLRNKSQGEEHPLTLSSRSDLAWSLYAQHKYKEAEQMHEEVLLSRNLSLGAKHRDTLSSYSDLAWSLYAQRNYTSAAKKHREALELREKYLGPEHNDTLSSYGNLGWSLYAQNDRDQALRMFEKARAGFAAKLGKDHWITLIAVRDEAMARLAMGKTDDAKMLYHTVYTERCTKLGSDHEDTRKAELDSKLLPDRLPQLYVQISR